MASKGTHWRWRQVAYGVAASAALPAAFLSPSALCLSLGLVLLPLVLRACQRVPFVRSTHGVEAVLVSALLAGTLAVEPRLIRLTLWLLLLLGLCHLAAGGLRTVLQTAAIALGFGGLYLSGVDLEGFPAFSAPSEPALHWAEGLAALGAAVLAVLFVGLGYHHAQRLHGSKLKARNQQRQLLALNRRFRRYVPHELAQRVTPAPRRRLALQERWLTLLFIDLEGFSARCEMLPASVTARLLNDCLLLLERRARLGCGVLSKFLGDGVLVAFDAGDERARAASNALDLGLAVAPGLKALRRRWRAEGMLTDLGARCGMASGLCSVGDWGARRLDYAVIGPPVNLAAKLQQQARVGELLIDGASAAILAGAGQPLPVEPMPRWLQGLGLRPVYVLPAGLVDPQKGSAMVADASRQA